MVLFQTLKSKKYFRDLPLLEDCKNLFTSSSLEGVSLICAQHLVSTTYTMFHYFFDLGLNPKDLYVIGKCYSTDPRVFQQLLNDGVNVSSLSTYFDSLEPYDERYKLNLSHFFSSSLKSLCSPKKLLILDDGGYLLNIANEIFPENTLVAGIEQTSAGYNLLKNIHLNFPVINVARSRVKLYYESPIIANLVVQRISLFFDNLLLIKPRVLIIGYGFIGKAIEKKLKTINGIRQIDLYDPIKKIGFFSEDEINKYIGDYDVIIGCSGNTVLSNVNYPYLKRPVFLISASSSDREFDAVKLRYTLPKTRNPHENLNIKGIHLTNCGFPYPFDGCYDEIDLKDFQLTRSLLLAAVLQANSISSRKVGFVRLNRNIQNQIIQKYYNLEELN
jgi:S-adenosylhomocysteine hydrolase